MVGIISGFSSSPANFVAPNANRPEAPAAPGPTATNSESTTTAAVPNTTNQVNPTVNNQRGADSRSNQNGGNGQRDSARPENFTPANLTNQRANAFARARTEGEGQGPTELSEQEREQVQKLRQRDLEVRAHEAAHLAAAGRFARGGAKFETTRGPDGRSYAVGGSVSIDTSAEATPEATLQKAEQIKRAALAPAEPSSQDRAVAASATSLKLQAQAELAEAAKVEAQQAREAADTGDSNAAESTAQPPASPSTAAEETPESPTASAPDATPSGNPVGSLNTLQSPSVGGTCAVCGGSHGTGGHLASNQAKADQFLSTAPAPGNNRLNLSA